MSLHVYHSNEPVYTQISEALLEEIRSIYEPGDYLPSEISLAERFGVNRHTMRRAIDELVRDGIVERYRGRGTIVLEAAIEYPLHAKSRFTSSLSSLGLNPSSQLLKKELVPALGGVAKRLEIKQGDPVVWMESLRLINNRPMGISSQFLPEPYASKVYNAYESGSLHSFLETHFELDIQRVYSLITAIMPQEEDALHLKMSRRSPMLRVKTINTDKITGKHIEYAVARSRADSVQLRVDVFE